MFYVFHDFDEEPRITAFEDESTRDPNAHLRGAMHEPEWFKNGVPTDDNGNPIFPKYEYYINPVDYKVDDRPRYTPYNS